MKIVNVEFRDDLDIASGKVPRDAREADISMTFSLGTDNYELEVSEASYEEIREMFAPLIAAARKHDVQHINLPCNPEDQATRKAAEKAAREHRDQIREWAASHRVWSQKYNGKGRIPVDLVRDYDAEHSPV